MIEFWLTLLLVVAAIVVGDLRWLRVAQREHYVPGEVSRIAALWFARRGGNAVLGVVVILLAAGGLGLGWLTAAAMLLLGFWPIGLAVRGRTSKLAWTARVKRLAAVVALLQLVLVVLTLLVSVALAGWVAILTPLLVDLALAALAPVERSLSQRFVDQATRKLRTIAPRIVAITGSYGKTSTKLYVQRLLARREAVLVSPASFNNLMGLSRTINDQLQPGTSVFVAEMGTYGEGEIRELCRVFPPDIAAITTIGEAHLARMKDRATIVRAKSEITETARVVVLNVDIPELAALAASLEATRQVIRCSSVAGATADVVVAADGADWRATVAGEPFAALPAPGFGHPINLACAIGIARALEVEVSPQELAESDLPVAPHRAEAVTGANGVIVIDDTYNSNPTGAAKAVTAAGARVRTGGRLFVVTPGMVELGSKQAERNAELARLAVSRPEFTLAVVGWTNRAALLRGAAAGPGEVVCFADRQQATAAVSARLGDTDVVLYENDLPDHYP